MSTESVMPFNHLILSPPSPPALNLAQHHSVFQWVGSSHQVAKVLEFQRQSFQWIFRVDFFKIDCFELPAVQGTLRSLLQHHSSNTWILWHSSFFIVQVSHPYMTTGKTIALTRWTFGGKVVCLFFNMLPGFVIAFLPRSKHLLISWLQSPSAVILELIKTNSSHSHCGECNGAPLQYSCLENPMDGGAWWAAVYGISKSRTRLNNFTFTFHFQS